MSAEPQERPSEETVAAWNQASLKVEVEGHTLDPEELAAAKGTRVHLITGWNPGGRPRALEANEAANEKLEAALEARGLEHYCATGRDASSSWEEPGFCVLGLSRTSARQLGARFGQVALYESSAHETLIVWCDSEEVEPKAG
jgi:hypothetical protein